MKKILFLISIMLCTSLHAQVCPDFTELSDSRPADDSTQWYKRVKRSRAAWGSTAVHYERHRIPENTNGKLKLRAWRGERVNAQAVFWTAQAAPGITLSKSELRNGKHVIAAENIELCFVRYVLTDSLKNNQGGLRLQTQQSRMGLPLGGRHPRPAHFARHCSMFHTPGMAQRKHSGRRPTRYLQRKHWDWEAPTALRNHRLAAHTHRSARTSFPRRFLAKPLCCRTFFQRTFVERRAL